MRRASRQAATRRRGGRGSGQADRGPLPRAGWGTQTDIPWVGVGMGSRIRPQVSPWRVHPFSSGTPIHGGLSSRGPSPGPTCPPHPGTFLVGAGRGGCGGCPLRLGFPCSSPEWGPQKRLLSLHVCCLLFCFGGSLPHSPSGTGGSPSTCLPLPPASGAVLGREPGVPAWLGCSVASTASRTSGSRLPSGPPSLIFQQDGGSPGGYGDTARN